MAAEKTIRSRLAKHRDGETAEERKLVEAINAKVAVLASRRKTSPQNRSVPGAVLHVPFLRKLQGLRSAGVAHRKGRRYTSALELFAPDGSDCRHVFALILNEAFAMLEALTEFAVGKDSEQSDPPLAPPPPGDDEASC